MWEKSLTEVRKTTINARSDEYCISVDKRVERRAICEKMPFVFRGWRCHSITGSDRFEKRRTGPDERDGKSWDSEGIESFACQCVGLQSRAFSALGPWTTLLRGFKWPQNDAPN